MSSESAQPSLRPIRPVDPSMVRVLRLINSVAEEIGCSYFVAGATARDLMLFNVHGLPPGRATRDIDFGIAVANWEQFARLKERLAATGDFILEAALQRLIYVGREGISIPIDLIPFGGVADPDRTIKWPPTREIVLNIAGFEEALASSASVAIDSNLIVRVASIPGLALLKLIAWSDRRQETSKDAADLYRLLASYAEAGNIDRLYDYELGLLEEVGFDTRLAGAELLGYDVALLCEEELLDQLPLLIESEQSAEQLLRQIARTSTSLETDETIRRGLELFVRGLKRVRSQ